MSNYMKLKRQYEKSTIEAFCIDQVKFELLGYQVYFNNNTSHFYETLEEIPQGNIKKLMQVGKPRKTKIQKLYEDAKSVFSVDRNFSKVLILLLLLIGTTATAQYAPSELNQEYGYFQGGLSGATKPHTEEIIFNGVFTAGVRYRLFDISANYEYADLRPYYNAWFASVKLVPITTGNFEFLIGGRYGRVMREDFVYLHYGAEGEIRYTFKKKHHRHNNKPSFFVALTGTYTFGGDKAHLWGVKTYWDNFTYSSYFKLGIKL